MFMTLQKARELLKNHVYIGHGYSRNAAKLVLAEVSREHGQQAVDALIVDLNMTEVFGFQPGERFKSP